MLRIAIVTNGLSQYRVPVFMKIAESRGIELHVFSNARNKSDKSTRTAVDENAETAGNFFSSHSRIIQNNVSVVSALARFAPDVVVTDDFDLEHLDAFFYALVRGVPHVAMMNGAEVANQSSNFMRNMVRRFVLSKSKAFITVGKKESRLLKGHGISLENCFHSCVCVDNDVFLSELETLDKPYDFIFCGDIEPSTNPLFALDVAVQVAKRLRRRARLLFVGSGSLEQDVRREAMLFPGLLNVEFSVLPLPSQLAKLYGASKILLFPTLADSWGMVTNEACAAGVPSIVSPHAGAAGELIRDEENGFVCALDVEAWANKAECLLTQASTYQSFSEHSRAAVRSYNFDSAAEGIVAACRYAISSSSMKHFQYQSMKSKPRVVIVERQLLHYRVAFYNRLRGLLEREGIELQLLIGEGTPNEKKKMDEADLEWAHRIPTRYLLGTNLCWQPFGTYAKEADLVIVMHENKIIYNLWLLLFARPRRLAFWGHGANMQSDRPDGFKERFKRWTIKKVDWWFAYTETSAALVTGTGFPSERTTVVENAFDTQEMAAFCRQISSSDCERKRKELNLGEGPIGLYLGSLYKEKRLDFLVAAAQRIRDRIPGFQLLVVGAGPEQEFIQAAASRLSWVRYLGPLQDKRKAEVLVLADVMLNPGLVGLGILDSFTSGTPMFTTDCGLHSPEISYLSSGHNGVMTANDVGSYADAIIEVLQEPDAITKLSKGALSSAPRYTVENMADRIRMGICACLALPCNGNINFRKT